MQPIPEDILIQFNAVLKQKSVPSSLHDDYRKWLKYYLDFRVKDPPPDIKSEQVRLFIEKMRSKGKSGKDLNHAAQALSLFFAPVRCGSKSEADEARHVPHLSPFFRYPSPAGEL
jgi:hypothetical protein